ncbi:hypothetical protein GDO78_015454 [Eleutherodactylus coqui]|uniref:Uncharacterized protein n=1 Tax=Eleutherodactylus coqui TaxID=57060 RepID=A0A8J6EKT3_ELECQ|nr:hypothetical protein GDO78_015454 [Eleutherodactylus coqui]
MGPGGSCLLVLCSVAAALWTPARGEPDVSILDEAQLLADHMGRLTAEELGVHTMQKIFNSFVYTEKISNGESEVQQVSSDF